MPRSVCPVRPDHLQSLSDTSFLTSDSCCSLGDRIVCVVQKQRGAGAEGMAAASTALKVKRGDIRHAVVVRTRQQVNRRDGSVIRFDDNACVLINKAGDPVGTRVNGIVGQELRKKKWSKILSMAPMQA